MGHGDRLVIVVRDSRDGNHYKVDFLANLQGEYKHDGGGGGFKPNRRHVFEAAKSVAAQYVTDELDYDLKPKSEWTWVKVSTAKRVIEQSDEYEIRSVDTATEHKGGAE